MGKTSVCTRPGPPPARRTSVHPRLLAGLLAGAIAATLAQGVCAQDYPNRPIRMVVGFAPGSATDSVARVLAEPLGSALGQPIVVENRPGVGSTLAAAQVARAPADGYTLTLGTNSAMATGPAGVIRNVGYDPVKDFTPLGRVATVSFMLVAFLKSQLVDWARFLKEFNIAPEN